MAAHTAPPPHNSDRTNDAPSANTLKAYRADWAHFTRWCRMTGSDPLPPAPERVGRYLSELAAPGRGKASAVSVATIDRRLSGLVWNYAQRGLPLDRSAPPIAMALASVRQRHTRPPVQKEAIRPDEIRAMVATLPHDLRGLRDRAILLLGYAGGLRRSEIVGLDLTPEETPGHGGRVEIGEGGLRLILETRTGLREIALDRGMQDPTCPVHALEQWLHFAKIEAGPVFTRVARDGSRALAGRLNDKHVARLIKRCVLAAGLRGDLPEKERLALFSGQSLRIGLASTTKSDKP